MADRKRAARDPQVQIADAQARRRDLGDRLNEHMRQGGRGTAGRNLADETLRTPSFGHRATYLDARYNDRPDLITHRSHHVHTYYDLNLRLHHRIIWPSYHFWVGYGFGPDWTFRYVYPYYHRKYVFVSLGGYWPADYTYARYYWYGWHPYVWYGYYPVAYEAMPETNNYYTYNYYGGDGSTSTYYGSDNASAGGQTVYVDHTTFADVREKLEKQRAEPAPQTRADTRFEEGVKSFESGAYSVAAEKFAEAAGLAPEDVILPFAYAQALFADGKYSESADALREALRKVSPDKETVFYPRGLYADDDVLFKQIERLVDKVEQSGDDADLQLLLGYHLLGTGETGYAREPLEQAGQAPENAEAAAVLLKLLDKGEKEAGSKGKAGAQLQGASDTQAETSSIAQVKPAEAALSTDAPGGAAAEGTSDTQDAEIKSLPDGSAEGSASQLAAGAATPADEQSAPKEDDDEP
jgi:hypothetical protein